MLSTLLLIVATHGFATDTPAQLVEQLGSPRYADREAATEALRSFGATALGPLRAARQSPEAEVRVRADGLVDAIEADLMVRPTLVNLDYRDVPRSDVLSDLSRQSGITLDLASPQLIGDQEPRLTLESEGQVTFWQAIDQVCKAGGLAVNPNMQRQFLGGEPREDIRPVLTLYELPGVEVPSTEDGPFRLGVVKLSDHRERIFGMPGSGPNNFFANQRGRVVPAQPGRPPVAGVDPRGGQVFESFVVELQLTAEPRITVLQDRPVRLLEAVDDRGQSLLQPGQEEIVETISGYNGIMPPGAASLSIPVALEMPERPGQSIKSLKIAVPLVVLSRRDDPLVVRLDPEHRGEVAKNAQVALKVLDVTNDPNGNFPTIKLAVKVTSPEAENQNNGFAAEMMLFRMNYAGNGQNRVEIVDEAGKPYPQWSPMDIQSGGPDGTTMTLRLIPTPGVGPPASIRYYELARAATEATFTLTDIPLP